MAENICVALAVDDDSARGAEVALYSFLSTNKWFSGDVVVVCNGSLSADNRERLRQLYYSVKYKDRLNPFSMLEIGGYKRALWLDAAILVRKDICDLFQREEDFIGFSFDGDSGESTDIFITKGHPSEGREGRGEYCNIKCSPDKGIIKLTGDFYQSDDWRPVEREYKEWRTQYHLVSGTIDAIYSKKMEDYDKYVVFTCAKNENEYIEEWVNHYLNFGIDKIFICDNNDDESLEEVLKKYIEDGTVEIFNCRRFKAFQTGICAMFCEGGNYKWCGYFDCDEFLELGIYSSIKDYLDTKKEDVVAFNWLVYGSNGKKKRTEGTVEERFPMPQIPINNLNNSFLKCFVRGGHFRYNDVINCGGHLPITYNENRKIVYNIGGYVRNEDAPSVYQSALPLRYKEGYIKHYYTKSFEEWINKANRGWANGKADKLPYYRFFQYENKSTMQREDYAHSCFISDESFEILDGDKASSFEKTTVACGKMSEDYPYPFISRIEYILSKISGGTMIITGDFVSDEVYNMILECGFITGNRVVYAKNNKEVEMAFLKYRKDTDNCYLYFEI